MIGKVVIGSGLLIMAFAMSACNGGSLADLPSAGHGDAPAAGSEFMDVPRKVELVAIDPIYTFVSSTDGVRIKGYKPKPDLDAHITIDNQSVWESARKGNGSNSIMRDGWIKTIGPGRYSLIVDGVAVAVWDVR